MICINEGYTHLFKKFSGEYVYPVTKGIYLAFDYDKRYIGVEMFYRPYNSNLIYKTCDIKLNDLLSKGILEIR